MQEGLYIRLLGEAELLAQGRSRSLPPSKKTRALLGYLALCGRPQRREKLCGLFWDVADDPRAALRWSLSKLRELVDTPGRIRLLADREQVQLDISDVRVDTLELRKLLEGPVEARGSAREQYLEQLPSATLEQALGYFRGELLEGLELSDFPAYHVWCLAEREQLRRLHTSLLSILLARAGAQPERALPLARQLVELDPLDGAARALFMELLHASGRAREAEEQSRSSQRLLLARPLAPEARSGERESSVSLPRESQLDLSRRERTPLLVGRTREFAQLSACLTRPGALRACLVEAEAGVGKTHLVQRAIAQLHVGSVLQGAALELTPRSPYAPWLSLLRAALGVHADLELSSLLAALTESAGEDSASLRERLFRGVSAFLERVCKQSGRLALVLDDTHWLDEGSAELLLHVSESCAALPISLLLTARPGVLGDNLPLLRVLRALRRSGVLEELQLLPFCEAETAELLRSLASPADPAEVQRDSAGNALFALELARARDAARREQDVPPSIARLVRDRIAALPAEVADVLRWASVLGGSFESERLTPLLALDEEAFVAALEQLQRHDFLGFRGSECVFSHAIVRAAVYDALSSPRRQLMHLKVARLLLEQADPSGLLAGELSRHALLGGDAALAVRACMAAGKRCLRLSAVADAYALSQRGLACVASLSEPERTTLEIELLHLSILARRGDPSGALSERLAELSERALELGAIGHASTATYLRAVLRWEAGHPADAQRFTREMERISRQGDLRQRMLSLGDAARCLAHLERDLPDAEAFALEAEQLAARSGAPVSSVLLARGTLQRYRGELDSAAHSLSQARELAQREGDRLNEMHVIEELLEVHWARADYAASERDSRELLALGERSRPGSEVAFARASIEIAQLACGADGAGLDAALAALEREDAKQRSACLLVRAAELSLTGQQHERADLFAARALALAALLERRSDAALAWSVRAEVAHARAEPRGLEVALLALVACLATPLSARAQASAAGVVARLNPPSQEKSHGTRNRRARIR